MVVKKKKLKKSNIFTIQCTCVPVVRYNKKKKKNPKPNYRTFNVHYSKYASLNSVIMFRDNAKYSSLAKSD